MREYLLSVHFPFSLRNQSSLSETHSSKTIPASISPELRDGVREVGRSLGRVAHSLFNIL